MSRNRSVFVSLLILSALGCAPEGPADFYNQTLQARSEFADTLTFIVDEPSAIKFFKPAEGIYKNRYDAISESWIAYDKKTEINNGFAKVTREEFKASDIGPERRQDMANALVAYQKFCEDLAFVN